MARITLEFLETRTLLSGVTTDNETPAKKKSGGLPNPLKLVKGVVKTGLNVAGGVASVAGGVASGVIHTVAGDHGSDTTPLVSPTPAPAAAIDAEASATASTLSQDAQTLITSAQNLANTNGISTIVKAISGTNSTSGQEAQDALETIVSAKVNDIESISNIISTGNAALAPKLLIIGDYVTEVIAKTIEVGANPTKILELEKVITDMNSTIEKLVGGTADKLLSKLEKTPDPTVPKKQYHGIGKIVHVVKGGMKKVAAKAIHDVITVLSAFDTVVMKGLSVLEKEAPGTISKVEKTSSKLLSKGSKVIGGISSLAQKVTAYNATEVAIVSTGLKVAGALANAGGGVTSLILTATGYGAIAAPIAAGLGSAVNQLANNQELIESIFKGIAAAGELVGVAGGDASTAMAGISNALQGRANDWSLANQAVKNATVSSANATASTNSSAATAAIHQHQQEIPAA